MIEETACNEEAALIEGGLPGVTGAGVTAADAPADAPVAGDSAAEALAAEASAENVSRETFAPEQGECMSRQRASLEVPVDMISIARTAQIEGAGLKLVAPAKVNLFLSIGDRRDNGYHDVSTVLHAVALHDVLYMKRADIVAARAALESAEEGTPTNTASAGPAGNILISISCDARGGVAPLNVPARENIVFKAIDLLARKADISYDDAINVRIEKNIPHEGGLGGGSSDAAAALIGAARLWGISEDDSLIEEAAHELGSDVAFFLHGGCACFAGTGELFDHELEAMKKPLVLIKPESGVSTAEAYRTFDGNPQKVGSRRRFFAAADRPPLPCAAISTWHARLLRRRNRAAGGREPPCSARLRPPSYPSRVRCAHALVSPAFENRSANHRARARGGRGVRGRDVSVFPGEGERNPHQAVHVLNERALGIFRAGVAVCADRGEY